MVIITHEKYTIVKIVTVPGHYMRNIVFSNLNIWLKNEGSPLRLCIKLVRME